MQAPTLAPVRVLLTRPAEQSRDWALALERAGATVITFPTITVCPPPSWQPLDEALARLPSYDWIVFSSSAAVRFTLARLGDKRWGARQKVAAVGGETARTLEAAGVHVDILPHEQRAEGLVASLSDLGAGTRVLFPQALGGRVELPRALVAQGCIVDVVPASQTIPVSPLPPVPAFDVATFASPSALRAFVAGGGLSLLADRPVVVLGATTAATAQALGLSPRVAAAPNIDAMLAAIASMVGT